MKIVFDIETAPLPVEHLKKIMPSFDEKEIKVGNIKDPDKIREKIDAARWDHELRFMERAALSAQTGRVLCIGFMSADGQPQILEGDEKVMLERFWEISDNPENVLIGHNSKKFDLPFLIRRSWIFGIRVPVNTIVRGRVSDHFSDTMEQWLFGQRQDDCEPSVSLNAIAKALGVGSKTDDGKRFSELYDKDREKALAYLVNDLNLTRLVAQKMGMI